MKRTIRRTWATIMSAALMIGGGAVLVDQPKEEAPTVVCGEFMEPRTDGVLGCVLSDGYRIVKDDALSVDGVVMEQALSMRAPREDERNFNCARHGNKHCAVKVDLTPNKKGGVRWYTLNFKTHKFALQSWRYR